MRQLFNVATVLSGTSEGKDVVKIYFVPLPGHPREQATRPTCSCAMPLQLSAIADARPLADTRIPMQRPTEATSIQLRQAR
jgi:hypothetical protein